ncbi:hypothetical protein ABT186_02215 [Streptomyces sp. NPDC001634]|uniref:hypothetical protein n=1 Tax=Streptomyces sp. NPDC001634 TaxID=3154390 RepID=UPI003331AED6
MPVTDGVLVHRYPMHPRLGRHQRLDGRSLWFIHRHKHSHVLKPTHWEPAIPVLDQEDLEAQGIHTSSLFPGAPEVDALGSCTGNAATAAVSRILNADEARAAGLNYLDAIAAEEWAIGQYAAATRVDDCAGQWPTDDTGSSGLANAQVLKAGGLIGGYRHALDADGLASLLQTDGVMLGMAWYNAFFEPGGPGAFIDADPDWARSGIAGGHEIYATGLEQIVQDHAGRVIPEKTVVTCRNSWSQSWGDAGSFRVHLSTLYGPLRSSLDAIQIHA